MHMSFICLGIVFLDNLVDLLHEIVNSNAHRSAYTNNSNHNICCFFSNAITVLPGCDRI